MIKPGYGADKSTYDNIDWDGFGVGSNVATVDVKDGKILRVRRLDYSAAYDLDKDLNRYRLEHNGKVFEEPTKSPIPPFAWAYKKHAFSKNRIPYPLIRENFDPNGDRHTELRGTDKYRRISWDEAATIVANEIHRQFELYGPGSILVQQDGHGETKIVHPCHGCMTGLCDQLGGVVVQARQPDSWEGWYWGAKHVWGQEPLGQGRTQNLFYDITKNCKMLLYWGCDNETTTWGWVGQIPSMLSYWFTDCGIESIAIAPDLNYSAAVHADKWIPVYPNTDLALQMAIAYVWLTEDLYDKDYIETHSIGFDWIKYEVLEGGASGIPKTPEWASKLCGVPSRIIKKLARKWAAEPTSIGHCNGGSYIRSCYSHEPGRMEVVLLGMQGLGKPGRNYMKFIEWNIYECPDFNPMPRTQAWPTGWGGYNAAMLEADNSRFIPKTLIPEGILCTPEQPIDWYGHVVCMEPADDQTLHFQFPAPGDPTLHMMWSDTPCWTTCWNCGNKYMEALLSPSMEFILVQHPWFENDCRFADIVLPVSTRFEVDDCGYDSSSGMFCTVIKSDKCVEPFGESKSDWFTVQEIAKKLEELYGNEERYANIFERYTGGRTVESSIESMYKASGMEQFKSYEQWLEDGYASVPHAEDWQEDHAGLYDFYVDPENHPLETPTGKLEFYSTRLAEHFPDDEERRPYPQYIASTERFHEYREDPKHDKYPFLLVSNHPRFRIHANFDDNAWLREIEPCKIKGPDGYAYEAVWINPKDAERLGIKTGDVVKVGNDRGWVLGGAYVTERIMPEVVSQDHGSRTDTIEIGVSDRAGANNLIAPKETTSKNAAGEVTSGFLVNVEKVDVFELAKQYPDAFNRTFDPAEGPEIENWLI